MYQCITWLFPPHAPDCGGASLLSASGWKATTLSPPTAGPNLGGFQRIPPIPSMVTQWGHDQIQPERMI